MENNEPIKKQIALYDLEINDDDETGITHVSQVNNPAIQIKYVAFASQEKDGLTSKMEFKIQDAAKRMLTGIFMKAGQVIGRFDEDTKEEYAVRFSAENIEKGVKKFFKNGFSKNVDTEHNHNLNGSYIVDSWFIRDKDSNPLKSFGFSVEPGDWVGTIFVENQSHWDEFIATGKLRGFSIDGAFQYGKKTMIDTYSAVEKPDKKEYLSVEELALIDQITDELMGD